MAITFGSVGTRFIANPATNTYNVPYPSGIAAGDFLILHMVCNGGSAVDVPSGWTVVYNESVISNPKGGLFYKIASGSESGTLTVTTPTSVTGNGVILRYTGVDTTTPLDVAASTVTNNTATTTTVLPSISTVTANTMLIYANGINTGSQPISATTGTERVDHVQSGGTGSKGGAVYEEARAATGATGTRTLITGSGWSLTNWGAMMALRPASSTENHTGTAAVSGSGTLTSTSVPNTIQTAPMTGSGTFTGASSSMSVTRSVALSGSGTLSGTATGISASANVSRTGSGTLTPVGKPGFAGAASLSGAGTLTASGLAIIALSGSASFSGSGTLSAAAKVGFSRAAGLTGSGTLTATAKVGVSRTVAFTGSGALEAFGEVPVPPEQKLALTNRNLWIQSDNHNFAYRANDKEENFYLLPSVYGGLKIDFGAESCLSHPDPATMSWRMWIPQHFEQYTPALGEKVSFDLRGDISADVFYGVIDSVKMKRRTNPFPITVNFAESIIAQDFDTSTSEGFSYNYDSVLKAFTFDNPNDLRISTEFSNDFYSAAEYGINYLVSFYHTSPILYIEFKWKDYETGTYVSSQYFGLDAGEVRGPNDLFLHTIEVTPPTPTATTFDLFAVVNTFDIGDMAVSIPLMVPAVNEKLYGTEVEVTASDISASIGRLRISETPWPRESINSRIARINSALYSRGAFSIESIPFDDDALVIGPRDVDNFSPLEAAQRAYMAKDYILVATDQLTWAPPLTTGYVLGIPFGQAERTTNNPSRVTIDAEDIEDTALAQDTTMRLTQAGFEFRYGVDAENPAGEDGTYVVINNDLLQTNGSSSRTLETDRYVSPGGDPAVDAPALVARVNAILTAQVTPQWTLAQDAVLLVKNIPFDSDWDKVLDHRYRFGLLINIEDGPADLEPVQRIHGGTFEFGETVEITLALESSLFSAPTVYEYTPQYLDIDPVTADLQINQVENLSFEDFKTINISF